MDLRSRLSTLVAVRVVVGTLLLGSAILIQINKPGAFPIDPPAIGLVPQVKGVAFGVARRVLEGLGLVPRTLRGRARLKRLVYGRLLEVPAELPADFAPVAPVTPLALGPAAGFKVIYVSARKAAAGTTSR